MPAQSPSSQPARSYHHLVLLCVPPQRATYLTQSSGRSASLHAANPRAENVNNLQSRTLYTLPLRAWSIILPAHWVVAFSEILRLSLMQNLMSAESSSCGPRRSICASATTGEPSQYQPSRLCNKSQLYVPTRCPASEQREPGIPRLSFCKYHKEILGLTCSNYKPLKTLLC